MSVGPQSPDYRFFAFPWFEGTGAKANLSRLVFVAVISIVALVGRLAIAPVTGGLQYVTFFAAVALSEIVGGIRAGLAAIAVGIALATTILTAPYDGLSYAAVVNAFVPNLVFLADGLIVCLSIEAMHRNRRVARTQQAVSAQVHAELEESQRIVAATFETHDAVMITDAEGRIIRVNHSFQRITGYRPDEVLGQTPRILKSGLHDAGFYEDMWRKLKTQGLWDGEVWDRRKDGEVYPKRATITALKNSHGEITEYVSIFSDITDRKRAEDEILLLAFYDVLTKLPNRRLLQDRLQMALSASGRTQEYGAVLFLDMDRFKLLNDSLGHTVGDKMLVEVADRITSCVRDIDTVARIGGDEFVVVSEGLGASVEEASLNAAQIAEKIRVALIAPYVLAGHTHHSSPSIGVCLFCDSDHSADTLLQQADAAMYQAKRSGRNSVRFFDPVLQQAAEARANLESDLRKALAEGQFHLYYQLQIDLDGKPTGAEALIRWVHPVNGIILPRQFIPIAEESSLICDIGAWVLDEACRQLALWSARSDRRDLILAINISPQQFRSGEFVDLVRQTLDRHGVNPALLKLELTENIILDDIEGVTPRMLALKNLGVRLTLDDFGTGYSSLAFLNTLPLDQVKIDQSFVRDLSSDPKGSAMVQAIIDMAANFKLHVIAEGVETQERLSHLKDRGCTAFQGFFFSEPVPLSQFEALLSGAT